MIAGLVDLCKNVVAVGTACGIVGGAYVAADGPLPAGQRYVDAGFARFELAQSQITVAVDRQLQSQLIQERSAYTRDPAAMMNPQVQHRVMVIDQQLAIVNRRIEEGEKRGIR